MSKKKEDDDDQLPSDETPIDKSPYFSFLITNDSGSQKRVVAVVSHSKRPQEEIDLHNTKKIKHTRSGAPNWKMTMLIGEFKVEEDSKKFSELWKTGTRGIPSKINRGMALAKEKKLTCYYDPPPK